ncbi:MAG: hypothetical protein K6U14_03035 [Firmicutes bacterium]|nr:hypothetical protein [Alicyclobacillaceae bacterium]MCL6496595.1 hypothetical protein [Bacillota bacterium]
MPSVRYGLIRLDIEDFLTAESDWALEVLLDRLDGLHLPASFGLVGEKVEAMAARGGLATLARVGRHKAVGFHSATHSRHPTLAEELESLPYEAGVTRFVEREGPGVEAVRRRVAPPRYFTQPGANWVPHAAEALPHLGMAIYFSEAMNSYLVPLTHPVWLADTLHFSPPVPTPLPFLHGLPWNLEQALARLRAVPREIPEGGFFCVMMHPTELVTTRFWDAVNFGGGNTRHPLRPAPLRPLAERDAAVAALTQYLEAAKALDGVQWLDVVTVAERVERRRPQLLPWSVLDAHLERMGLYPLRTDGGQFSPAQLVWALAYFACHPGRKEVVVPLVRAPRGWAPGQAGQASEVSRREAVAAAEAWLEGELGPEGVELPRVWDGCPIEVWAARWWAACRQPATALVSALPLPLTFLAYVREPEALHWDWPIFAPDFRPYRLWLETRRLAWTVAPVAWTSADRA